MYKFLLKSHRFPPTLILRILPLLRGFGVEIEAAGADVHLFVIVEIGLLRTDDAGKVLEGEGGLLRTFPYTCTL